MCSTVMRLFLLVLALMLVPLGSAQASTFRPNMWVYEVSVTPVSAGGALVFADTLASADAAVPDGCRSSPTTDPSLGPVVEVRISCRWASAGALGIDVLKEVRTDPLLTYTSTIGFNATDVVCLGTLLGCGFDRPTSSSFLTHFEVDYEIGALKYALSDFPDFSDGSADEAYDLGPASSSMTGLLARGYGGDWDYGFGGRWSSSDTFVIRLAGTGTLIQTPTTVPLPASAWLLGASVLGLVSLRRRNWKG